MPGRDGRVVARTPDCALVRVYDDLSSLEWPAERLPRDVTISIKPARRLLLKRYPKRGTGVDSGALARLKRKTQEKLHRIASLRFGFSSGPSPREIRKSSSLAGFGARSKTDWSHVLGQLDTNPSQKCTRHHLIENVKVRSAFLKTGDITSV